MIPALSFSLESYRNS